MDYPEFRGHLGIVGLAVVGALAIWASVLDRYPLGVQLAVGLPALAAIGIAFASFSFSLKSDKFKLAGLALGIAVLSGLLLWLLHQWFPPV